MSDFLFQYRSVDPTSWVYLSSLLLIGLFFKFSRLWSVRNLDLILIILLGPGLLMIHQGQMKQGQAIERAIQMAAAAEAEPESDETTAADGAPIIDAIEAVEAESGSKIGAKEVNSAETETGEGDAGLAGATVELWGFRYLIAIGGFMLARMLLDPMMVRRPLLEPNLSKGGLIFIGISLFVFLMGNLIAEPEPPVVSDASDFRIARVAPASTEGPGYELLSVLPTGFAKAFCVVVQLLIVIGIVLTGFWHFRNIVMGVGAATLYLMLPYTSMLTGRIEHILPAATLVWAILWYRRPIIAGALLGLASGLVYYPFFLLPLWLSFYWHRGFRRFLTAYLVVLSALTIVLLVYSSNGLFDDLTRMFGIQTPAMQGLSGVWNRAAGGINPSYRLPVLVAFVALSISMAIWPAQKNLGTLLSCTSAIMVATQFWHGYGGGTYMAWYLPTMLLTVFRPNLEDRVAVSVLAASWFPNRLAKAA